jgi:hypothetical protein
MFIIALFVFFAVTALKDFGVPFKYWDLIRGLAAATVAVLLVLGRGL